MDYFYKKRHFVWGWATLWLSLTSLISLVNSQPRPFWNIAHMVNSIKEVSFYVSKGANGIESDITFDANGTAIATFHGYPCDCFRHCMEREDLDKFLIYVREASTPGTEHYKRNFVLQFLDLKVSSLAPSVKALAGQDLASKLLDHLFQNGKSQTQLKLILSIGHVYDSDFVLGFQNELEKRELTKLNERIGWDVGLNDPLALIDSMWKRVEVIENIWQGDGRTNCLSPFYNLGRLTAAVRRRDEINLLKDPFIDKVYHWTIDLTSNLRASLRTNVDAIMTNHPERLSNVLREVEFSQKFRLADPEDNPFERIQARIDDRPSPAAPITQPIGVRVMGGLGDMMSSFTKYVADIIYLRVPRLQNIARNENIIWLLQNLHNLHQMRKKSEEENRAFGSISGSSSSSNSDESMSSAELRAEARSL